MAEYDPLPLVVVETDGGAYGPQFRVENMLKDDSTVYSTAPSRREDVNVVLCCSTGGQPANCPPSAFSLRAITAAAPTRGFTSPLAHAIVFVSWERPSLASVSGWRSVCSEQDFQQLADAHMQQAFPCLLPSPQPQRSALPASQPHCPPDHATTNEPSASAPAAPAPGILASGREWHARHPTVSESAAQTDDSQGSWATPPGPHPPLAQQQPVDTCTPGSGREADGFGDVIWGQFAGSGTTTSVDRLQPTASPWSSLGNNPEPSPGPSLATPEASLGLASTSTVPDDDSGYWHSPRAVPRAAAAAALLGNLGTRERVSTVAVGSRTGEPSPWAAHQPEHTLAGSIPVNSHAAPEAASLHSQPAVPHGAISSPSGLPHAVSPSLPPATAQPAPQQQPPQLAHAGLHPHVTPVAFIDLEGVTSRTITLDAPKTGRYILVKLLRPRARYGEGLDVERLVLGGHVGPPAFASGALV